MSNMFARTKNSFVKGAMSAGNMGFFILLCLLSGAGFLLVKSDVAVSYEGYGVLAKTKVNIPDGKTIAWVVSLIPTFWQMSFILGMVTEKEYSENPIVSVSSAAMFLWDTTLDIIQMMEGHGTDWQSWLISIVMVVIVYGMMSEMLVTIMFSSAVGIAISWIKNLFGDSGNWSMGGSRSTPSPGRAQRSPGISPGGFTPDSR